MEQERDEVFTPSEEGWYWARHKPGRDGIFNHDTTERVVHVARGDGDAGLCVWGTSEKGAPLDDYEWLEGPLSREENARLRGEVFEAQNERQREYDLRCRFQAELEAARAANERDRSAVAVVVDRINKILRGYGWLAEGRGPYAHDDEEYQKEFGRALDALNTERDKLAEIAKDWEHCPSTSEEVRSARASVEGTAETIDEERMGLAIKALKTACSDHGGSRYDEHDESWYANFYRYHTRMVLTAAGVWRKN